MIERPRTFTAPVSGTYHVVTGQEPHLAEDCSSACQPIVTVNAIEGSTLGVMNSGKAVKTPAETIYVGVTWMS